MLSNSILTIPIIDIGYSPTNPDPGYTKLYQRNDGKYYTLDSNGSEEPFSPIELSDFDGDTGITTSPNNEIILVNQSNASLIATNNNQIRLPAYGTSTFLQSEYEYVLGLDSNGNLIELEASFGLPDLDSPLNGSRANPAVNNTITVPLGGAKVYINSDNLSGDITIDTNSMISQDRLEIIDLGISLIAGDKLSHNIIFSQGIRSASDPVNDFFGGLTLESDGSTMLNIGIGVSASNSIGSEPTGVTVPLNTWLSTVFQNSWQTYLSPFQYLKDELGFVHLRGSVQIDPSETNILNTGSIESVISNLPVGFRISNSRTMIFNQASSGGGTVFISDTGNITAKCNSSVNSNGDLEAWISLDGIYFLGEQ